MGWRWRIRPGRTFSPLRRRRRLRLRQPARPSGCTSSPGRSSSDLQRWSLSPTVISEASSRFLIRSPTTRQTPPSIQGRQAGPPGRHHARLPSNRITLGTPDDPDDRRDEKSTLYELARRNQLPAPQIGRRWIFRRSLLNRARLPQSEPSSWTGTFGQQSRQPGPSPWQTVARESCPRSS